jgi:hypothetical protein
MSALVASLPSAVGSLDTRVQIVAVAVTGLMLLLVLELVRRRRLIERYALLWMLVAFTLLVLSVWTGLLSWAADAIGIAVPANFLFLAAFGVGFVLLLHFSVAISRLSEETKILAQEVARLDAELRAARRNGTGPANGEAAVRSAAAGAPADETEGDRPIAPKSRPQ